MSRAFAIISLLISLVSTIVASPVEVWHYGAWDGMGCYIPRVLHHQVGSSPTMSVGSCLDTCDAAGFAFGGVEYGSECYCGNTLLHDYGYTYYGCNMPCSGNPDEYCGGPNAMEVYHKTNTPYSAGPPTWLNWYRGWFVTQCWQDDNWPYNRPRLLPHWPNTAIPAEQMTVERCIDGCAASGYTNAGVEYGQECWCGDVTFPPGQSDPGHCNMPCLGNASESCGDVNRVLIYARR